MSQVLIIRSAPIQQLDASLPKIRSFFDNPSISILSHRHCLDLLRKYNRIEQIIPYPYKGSFDYKSKVFLDSELRFDHAVVMVGNLSGTGFINVLFFALTLPAKKIWICNLIGELKFVPRPLIVLTSARNLFYKAFSLFVSFFFCLFTLPFLALFLVRKPT